jgi:hypothetical protein
VCGDSADSNFILLVGRPTIAFAVVLFALLIASGLGVSLRDGIPWSSGAVLTILIALYPTLVRALTTILLAPIEAARDRRALALFPLGFCGMMFPKGSLTSKIVRRIDSWAWGINGAMSVISAIDRAAGVDVRFHSSWRAARCAMASARFCERHKTHIAQIERLRDPFFERELPQGLDRAHRSDQDHERPPGFSCSINGCGTDRGRR